jgi:hypothetical protein
MNQIEQLIEEFAHLEHKATILRAHGKHVPADITLRMEAIAAWGRANIHPAHFAAAIRQKDGRLAELHMQRSGGEQQFHQVEKKQLLDHATAKLTRGMLGQPNLNSNQLSAIVNKLPLRARMPNQEPTQAQRDAHIRNSTKQYDPRGIGWGEKEFQRRLDELVDAESNEKELVKLMRKYRGANLAGIRDAIRMWKVTRVDIGLQQRVLERQKARGETENPIIREVPDRDHRKAVLATAMLADAAEQSDRGDTGNIDGFLDRHDYSHDEGSGTAYNGDSNQRRGDIARAFDRVEQIGYDNG